MLDGLRRMLEKQSGIERRLERLEQKPRHVGEFLGLSGIDNAGVLAYAETATQAMNDIQVRLDALESALRQFQIANASAAETRHASMWQLSTDQHHEVKSLITEKSEGISGLVRHLEFTLAERLSRVELGLRTKSTASATTTSTNSSVTAATVRDFLQIQTEEDPPSVWRTAGSIDVQLPAWDKVVAPWLDEYKEWEPAVTRELTRLTQPGFTVIDVGAHVGIFTLLMSQLVGPTGHVVALEPDPLNARFLRRNIMGRGCTNVLVLEVAAADKSRVLPLSRPPDDNTGDSRTYDVATMNKVSRVNAFALDDLVPGPVHLVKLDLQGMDHVALLGMQRILREQQPVMIVEFWPHGIRAYGDDPHDVIHWLRSLDYSWVALELPDLTDGCSDDDICAAVEDSADGYVNLLLQPTAKYS